MTVRPGVPEFRVTTRSQATLQISTIKRLKPEKQLKKFWVKHIFVLNCIVIIMTLDIL
jgi:hypothetical protein